VFVVYAGCYDLLVALRSSHRPAGLKTSIDFLRRRSVWTSCQWTGQAAARTGGVGAPCSAPPSYFPTTSTNGSGRLRLSEMSRWPPWSARRSRNAWPGLDRPRAASASEIPDRRTRLRAPRPNRRSPALAADPRTRAPSTCRSIAPTSITSRADSDRDERQDTCHPGPRPRRGRLLDPLAPLGR